MNMENQAQIAEGRDPLLDFKGVTVEYGAKAALRNLTWSLEQGRNWAVIGSNGSGKSTLLKLIRGDIMPSPGQGFWSYLVKGSPQRSPLGFKERTRLVSSDLLDAYRRNNWNLSCRDAVLTGYEDTIYLQEKPDQDRIEAALAALAEVGLERSARAGITTLSQGQAKRVLLARALISGPDILLLDEVCEGLDSSSRAKLLARVERAAQQGAAVIQAVHRIRELIPATGQLPLPGGRNGEGRRRDGRSERAIPARSGGQSLPGSNAPNPGRRTLSGEGGIVPAQGGGCLYQQPPDIKGSELDRVQGPALGRPGSQRLGQINSDEALGRGSAHGPWAG